MQFLLDYPIKGMQLDVFFSKKQQSGKFYIFFLFVLEILHPSASPPS
jgi:hypothetical protein